MIKAFTYPHRFSVAPMMDWTTSECRQFHRLLSKQALLFTEMVTTGAVLHGGHERFLAYEPIEHPIALQLGGSNAEELAQCAKLAEQYGYDEINLNAGCPSDRVQNGMIGAILMAHSQIVADGIKAMQDAVSVPISIKHRIGIDDFDSYEFLRDFVGSVAETGCNIFTVHARKAILQGLSPKENREIPPLDYARVLRLKQDFPNLTIIINGGIKTHELALSLIEQGLDGVMLGREAYQNPLILQQVDELYYGKTNPIHTPRELSMKLHEWVQGRIEAGTPLKYVARHMLGLYPGKPGAKQFRRLLSEKMHRPEADLTTFSAALDCIRLEESF